MPSLSDRRNVIVIADEAHRSQYEFGSHLVTRKDGTSYLSHGLAVNIRDALPNASFIGFTGTPIEKTDANTRAAASAWICTKRLLNCVRTGPAASAMTRRLRKAASVS